jgi:hypothetical protein
LCGRRARRADTGSVSFFGLGSRSHAGYVSLRHGWKIFGQNPYHRQMFGKSSCQCHRCVARRRLCSTFVLALFALMSIGYLALPDLREFAPAFASDPRAKTRADLTENGPKSRAKPAESAQTPILSETPLEQVAAQPNRSQVVVAASSPESNPADPGADFGIEKLDPKPAPTKPASTPLAVRVVRVQHERDTPDRNASSSNSIAPQLAGPATPAAQDNPNPSLASAGPAVRQAFARIAPMQNDDADENASSPESHEPRGYITIESRPAPPRTGSETGPAPRLAKHGPSSEQTPPAPREKLANIPDSPPRVRATPDKLEPYPTGDLQRFAADFVQTDKSGNVEEQRRFYSDSVHFYNEGDLSWSSVEAATRRYHRNRQNEQYQVAAAPIVKGPVNGGFYVIDQPVSWSRVEGSTVVRGRSILRLRVLATGRAGWKITSIEEAGR